MPDDTDLTPQDATPAAEGSEDVTSTAPAPETAAASFDTTASANATGTPPTDGGSEALIQLALTDLQSRRDALQQEIEALSQRKQALEKEMTASFAGQSDAIARKVKGFQDYLGGASKAWCSRWRPWSWWCSRWWCSLHRWTPKQLPTPLNPPPRRQAPHRRWRTPSAPMKR